VNVATGYRDDFIDLTGSRFGAGKDVDAGAGVNTVVP